MNKSKKYIFKTPHQTRPVYYDYWNLTKGHEQYVNIIYFGGFRNQDRYYEMMDKESPRYTAYVDSLSKKLRFKFVYIACPYEILWYEVTMNELLDSFKETLSPDFPGKNKLIVAGHSFGAIGSVQAAVLLGKPDLLCHIGGGVHNKNLKHLLNKRLKEIEFHIVCGVKDNFFRQNMNIYEVLLDEGCDISLKILPGGHQFEEYSDYMTELIIKCGTAPPYSVNNLS